MRFSPFSSDTVQRIINDNRIVVLFGRINDLADPGIGINRVAVHLRPVDPRNLVSGDATHQLIFGSRAKIFLAGIKQVDAPRPRRGVMNGPMGLQIPNQIIDGMKYHFVQLVIHIK